MDYGAASNYSDQEIVRLMQSDIEEGLRRLLQKYGGKIRGWLCKRYATVLQDCEYDEILSTAAYNAWRFSTRYDVQKGSLGAWFLRIAQHAAIDKLRSENRHRHAPIMEKDLEDHASQQTSSGKFPSETASKSAIILQLESAVKQLPPLQRAIIEADLAANGRAAADRLAAQYQTSVSVIYVSRNKAIKRLRKLLQIQVCDDV